MPHHKLTSKQFKAVQEIRDLAASACNGMEQAEFDKQYQEAFTIIENLLHPKGRVKHDNA